MSEPLVVAAYILTYGAVLGYGVWLHMRSRVHVRPGVGPQEHQNTPP